MRYFLFVLTTMAFIACSDSSSKQKEITGKWKPVSFQSDLVSNEESAEMLRSASIEFTAGQQFITYFSGKKEEEGAFTLDEKNEKLTVTNRKENQVYYISWKADTLVLTNDAKEVMKLLKQ